ncbi:MAG: hypothetical protein ABEJ87_04060 [Candidatus Nanohalobium sp.]
MSRDNIQQIDLSPEFPEDQAEKYAREIVHKVGKDLDFQHVADFKYVTSPGLFEKFLPGAEEYVIRAEDTMVRYNPEYISEEDIEEAVDERTEKARQEFTGWKSIKQKLE